MTRRLTLFALVLLGAAIGVGVSGILSPGPSEPQVTQDDHCNTCDARQQAKKRLRERLQAAREAEE